MKLPGGERAVVDMEKLRGYCLNPLHPRGRHKARVFSSALRLTQANAGVLRSELLNAAQNLEALPGESDAHGDRYWVDFELVHEDRQARVRSGWIVRRGEQFPRLTSCFVLLD